MRRDLPHWCEISKINVPLTSDLPKVFRWWSVEWLGHVCRLNFSFLIETSRPSGWKGATAATSWQLPPRSFETSWRIGWAQRVSVSGKMRNILISCIKRRCDFWRSRTQHWQRRSSSVNNCSKRGSEPPWNSKHLLLLYHRCSIGWTSLAMKRTYHPISFFQGSILSSLSGGLGTNGFAC